MFSDDDGIWKAELKATQRTLGKRQSVFTENKRRALRGNIHSE